MNAADAGAAASSAHSNDILIALLLMFAAAKLFAEIFQRLKQPAVVVEILAVVLIGTSVLGWVSPNEITHPMAELCVLFLLSLVCLETTPLSLLHGRPSAMLFAVLRVIVPFIPGWSSLPYSG